MWNSMFVRVPLVLLLVVAGAHFSPTSKPTIDDETNISCKNPAGKTVEWFIIYKIPKDADRRLEKSDEHKGTTFGYYDSTMTGEKFTENDRGIDVETDNPLATSLQEIFKMDESEAKAKLTYVVYNDQPPPYVGHNESGRQYHEKPGHTKGVIVFGPNTGLWLVHSVPHFPGVLFEGKYSYPSSGHVNGQTAICVSLVANQLDLVASHLRRQQPVIYQASAPSGVRSSHPELDLLLKKRFANKEPFHVANELVGIEGTKLTAFAKSGFLDEDVYRDVIAPYYKTDIYVQSWRNGPGGKMPADCNTTYKVLDITKLSVPIGNNSYKWSTEEDHAKWAITSGANWVCIGSINRMHSQFARGGETICLQNESVHSIFQQAVADKEKCPILTN